MRSTTEGTSGRELRAANNAELTARVRPVQIVHLL